MELQLSASCRCGEVRTHNEDMALLGQEVLRETATTAKMNYPTPETLAVLAFDGLGGMPHGDVASETGAKSLASFTAKTPPDRSPEDLDTEVKLALTALNDKLMHDEKNCGMATTVTGLVFCGPTVLCLNAGDSRTYRLRKGKLEQLTVDHSECVRDNNPYIPPNIMYNCVGHSEFFVDVKPVDVAAGDVFLACSDGVTGMLKDKEICKLMASGADADAIVAAAIKAGGNDNATALVVRVS